MRALPALLAHSAIILTLLSASNDAFAIVGGREVKSSETVSKLVAAVRNFETGKLCSATLVADRILITAAHCVAGTEPSQLGVVFGNQVGQDDQGLDVSAVVINPDYRPKLNHQGDLALIALKNGAPSDALVAELFEAGPSLRPGLKIFALGYGTDDDVALTGSGKLRIISLPLHEVNRDDRFLIADQSAKGGGCHGDSGGPAFIKTKSNYLLAGVLSGGRGGQDCRSRSAFVEVLTYRAWIERAMLTLRTDVR
jgi:secreted trypsin-like serine protease